MCASPLAVLVAWLLAGLLLSAWLWLSLARPVPGPAGPPADPYAGDVAAFRRELHDWDREA